MNFHPSPLLDFRLRIELTCYLPEVLASVVEIHDLDGVQEVFRNQIPDPLRTIADHDLLSGATPATLPSFPIDPCKHTSQLDLPRMRGLTCDLAWSTHRLFLHDRNSGPIHLYIQHGNGPTEGDGQIQLQGFLDLSLRALGDIGSDRFRRTLHGLGRHLQAGQDLDLFAAVLERRLLTHQGLHPAHPGRKFRSLASGNWPSWQLQ